ncbi:MAG: fibrobacter succinogenes major paralogous domain-containing protein [Bacteroidales bacterium]|jgi:uncharacterized protein (TIGR02145 family)|nr:fibrobacter succinogenes major paralogous domain-containing protein [Bacteroidales bacterium]
MKRSVKSIFFFKSLALVSIMLLILSFQSCKKFEREISVATGEISQVKFTTCAINGRVIVLGEDIITEHGFCYSLSTLPDISDYTKKLGPAISEGAFSTELTGLTTNMKYYVRAFASNNLGTSYGNEAIFETMNANEYVFDYDENFYTKVKIGTQVWMAENLKTTHYEDGTKIQLLESDKLWADLSISDKAMCYYDNSLVNAKIYGALYTWATAMNGANSSSLTSAHVQGICPTGWHLPSDEEWTKLTDYLGGGSVAGDKMKESEMNYWIEHNNATPTNESGFSGLPGGFRVDQNGTSNSNPGDYYAIGGYGLFASSTEANTYEAYDRILSWADPYAEQDNTPKNFGFSVRCIKD